MNIETRRTASGTEYWDTEEKRIRFVPVGKEPDFEVTQNPKSYVTNAAHARDRDQSLTTKVKTFEEFNTKELLKYAEENNVEVPGTMKKADTIRAHILSELDQRKNADDESDGAEEPVDSEDE